MKVREVGDREEGVVEGKLDSPWSQWPRVEVTDLLDGGQHVPKWRREIRNHTSSSRNL